MNKSNKCFISVDFEEWFHLPYLAKYNFSKDDFPSYCRQTVKFFEFLKEKNIKATIFIVADIAERYSELIRQLDLLGHEIACHSLHHESVNLQTNNDFYEQTKEAKKTIEKILGHSIYGFRAPSFSMTIEKLNILKELGFLYDASYINSTANEYYNKMDITKFNKIDSLVYTFDNLYEFETPTCLFMGKNMPFAGGGFFRFYPFFIFKKMFKKYKKSNHNFMFFIHPYEIVGTKFPGTSKLTLKDAFRINIRRKSVIKRFEKMLNLLNNYEYITYSEYIKEEKNEI